MEIKKIRISDIEANTGQIDGLPHNPRKWAASEVEKLKKSILETPELLEARGIIVYPHEDKFIALGGNMRLMAVKKLGWKEVPCIILPEQTNLDKLKEIVIKDNSSFGEWDIEALNLEWGDVSLSEWGVKANWEEESGSNDSNDDSHREVQEDDYSEEENEIQQRVKLGELWKCGSHIIMCGDSADPENVKKLMGG